jgi:hypothetical protein
MCPSQSPVKHGVWFGEFDANQENVECASELSKFPVGEPQTAAAVLDDSSTDAKPHGAAYRSDDASMSLNGMVRPFKGKGARHPLSLSWIKLLHWLER